MSCKWQCFSRCACRLIFCSSTTAVVKALLIKNRVELYLTDIDECSNGTDNCHEQATCTNTAGNFTCACNAGYTGDGTNCQGNRLYYMSAN